MLKTEIDEELCKYQVGALLYSPANSDKILRQITERKIAPPYSVALCLEDAIADSSVKYAEEFLLRTISYLKRLSETTDRYIPDVFIRVRNSSQPEDLIKRAGENSCMIKGFIFPKYSISNADEYNSSITAVNKISAKKIYMMPILESGDIMSIRTRMNTLAQLKDKIDSMHDYVLNVRVGGNDFCNCFGLRRNISQTIYDICVVRDCISDILNTFLPDYVVSAPVWEYFGDENNTQWKKGMKKEVTLDKLNGFIGKTVIHPSQVPVINDSLKVSAQDYNDAVQIINWNSSYSGVEKGHSSGRMNEVKCHTKWAVKILALARIYGVKEVTA